VAIIHPRDEEQSPPSQSVPPLLSTVPVIQDNDPYELITDFFDWLETAWQLPLYATDTKRGSFPLPFLLAEGLYSLYDLNRFYGYDPATIQRMLKQAGILPVRYAKGNRCSLYRKQDLAPLVECWEWKRLIRALDQWWLPFFPPACGVCCQCRRPGLSALSKQLHCVGHESLGRLRLLFANFLTEMHQLGSVAAWWRTHHVDNWRGATCSNWGILLIYLLDRRLLHLSNDELLQLRPICNKSHQDLTRLWRHRCPDEYDQFLQAIKAANYRCKQTQEQALAVVSLLILLKHGLTGMAELSRSLSSEEIQQLCNNRRLITMYLGLGIFLPCTLTTDIRVGHVILDDIRYYFWRYAAEHKQQRTENGRWSRGPRNWRQMNVSMIEQALAAPVYEGKTAILSRRPETERILSNPWYIVYEGERTDTGYAFLPTAVQKDIMVYLTSCYQEQHLELTTIRTRARTLMHFFTWIRRQGKLDCYPYWSKESAQALFRTYTSMECAGLKATTRHERLIQLLHFFTMLAGLEYPVPPGYRLLGTLAKKGEWHSRVVPREEVLDRVFREGVCQLSYEPYARLALTIQYYCGTRVTETCDLHLFCILEDREGHAYLLIPRGKTKEERPFPIVELGMGPLLNYMDEIVTLRLFPDGTSRTLGKTNYRYLAVDPERATDWHYLFDRVSDDAGRRRGRLSDGRVSEALQEALRIAAKVNPDGLFQEETYQNSCRHQRRKGQLCRYFAAKAGVMICPCCGSRLSGKLGARCYHRLEKDFICNGIAQPGEVFCPKCDTPLAEFLPITTHTFRHNSVSRAHQAGVPVAQNMRLHGHKTLPMHLRYLHLLLEDTTNEVRQIFAEKRLRDVGQMLGSTTGKMVEGGITCTVSLEHYLGMTLQRALKRRTYGIWGGFWAGALAQRGIASPLSVEDEIVIPEDTYEHTVAQYWYEALGLAVSEIAFEHVTSGKWCAEVPSFLDRHKIEALVQFHLHHLQDSFKSALGQRLMETDILEQRRFLDDLAEKLHPWWKHLGTIDQLIEMFAPGGGHAFHKQLPPTESEA